MQDKRTVDVSMLVTFHAEGIFAHSTLNSIERCRRYAEELGITSEYIFVFDATNDETRRIVQAHPAYSGRVAAVDVAHRDPGASRNSGIKAASGEAIAILDGDDYFSTNWIERAWHFLGEYGPNAILHPECLVNFGTSSLYCWQVDQAGKYYDEDGLLHSNYWTSWTFAKRQTYLDCPYFVTRPAQTGFGYEDWHWNCETIAHGFQHRLAWGTVGFYRRKRTGSLVSNTTLNRGLIAPTALFAPSRRREGAR